jgi:Uma2 family endonuclease
MIFVAIIARCMAMTPLTLNLDTVHLSDEQFYQLCQNNRELQFERTEAGELIIMPPVGGESGNREADIIIDLGIWNRQTNLGYTFSDLLHPNACQTI